MNTATKSYLFALRGNSKKNYTYITKFLKPHNTSSNQSQTTIHITDSQRKDNAASENLGITATKNTALINGLEEIKV